MSNIPQPTQQPDDADGVQFARTPGRDIFGKLDDHLPEVRIPFEVKQAAERAARADGCGDLTTWLRELVYARLIGPEHLGTVHAQRSARVLGNARQEPDAQLVAQLLGRG